MISGEDPATAVISWKSCIGGTGPEFQKGPSRRKLRRTSRRLIWCATSPKSEQASLGGVGSTVLCSYTDIMADMRAEGEKDCGKRARKQGVLQAEGSIEQGEEPRYGTVPASVYS